MAVDNTQQTLETMKEYIDSSVVMGLDAYHLNTGILSYYINTDGMSESERVNLLAVYKTFTEDGRLADALLQADDSIEKSELQYLISFNVESSNTMQTASDKTSVVYVTGRMSRQFSGFRLGQTQRKDVRPIQKLRKRRFAHMPGRCRERWEPILWSCSLLPGRNV